AGWSGRRPPRLRSPPDQAPSRSSAQPSSARRAGAADGWEYVGSYPCPCRHLLARVTVGSASVIPLDGNRAVAGVTSTHCHAADRTACLLPQRLLQALQPCSPIILRQRPADHRLALERRVIGSSP